MEKKKERKGENYEDGKLGEKEKTSMRFTHFLAGWPAEKKKKEEGEIGRKREAQDRDAESTSSLKFYFRREREA